MNFKYMLAVREGTYGTNEEAMSETPLERMDTSKMNGYEMDMALIDAYYREAKDYMVEKNEDTSYLDDWKMNAISNVKNGPPDPK